MRYMMIFFCVINTVSVFTSCNNNEMSILNLAEIKDILIQDSAYTGKHDLIEHIIEFYLIDFPPAYFIFCDHLLIDAGWPGFFLLMRVESNCSIDKDIQSLSNLVSNCHLASCC